MYKEHFMEGWKWLEKAHDFSSKVTYPSPQTLTYRNPPSPHRHTCACASI